MKETQHSSLENSSEPSQPGHPSTDSVSDQQSTRPSEFDLHSAKIYELTVTVTKIGDRLCSIDGRVVDLEARARINNESAEPTSPDYITTQAEAITQ